jgi:predicted TIM-barrel fold metal-dependent hydrolase
LVGEGDNASMAASPERTDGSHTVAAEEIVDFGGHFFTDAVPFRPDSMAAFDDLVGPAFTDPEAYAAVQRAAGITGTVLVAPAYVQHGTADQVATANDVLLDVVSGNDHFVGGLASIPFNAPEEVAAAEFERCLEAGYSGGVIETINDGGVELIDEAVEPVFEVADRTGAPIFVHPRVDSSLHPVHDVLGDRYKSNAIFGREVTLLDSVYKVIHAGVLDRYPNLHLVYDHFGGNLAANLGRIEYQLDADRWPGDQDDLEDWESFRAQLEERISLKMSGYYGYHAPLRATLEEFPSSKVLFGTDFPFEVRTADELAECIETVDDLASEADARRIFSGNVRDLLVHPD